MKLKLRTFCALAVILCLYPLNQSFGQGCVAIRGFSSCGGSTGGGNILKPGESQAGIRDIRRTGIELQQR